MPVIEVYIDKVEGDEWYGYELSGEQEVIPVLIPDDVPKNRWWEYIGTIIGQVAPLYKEDWAMYLLEKNEEYYTLDPTKARQLEIPESCRGLDLEDIKKYEIGRNTLMLAKGKITKEDLKRKRIPRKVIECIEELAKL